MVVLDKVDAVGKAAGDVELDLVLGLVGAVTSAALGLPADGLGERVVPGQLADIVGDAVLIDEVLGLELPVCLIAQAERHARVHHGLPLERVAEVVDRDVDVGEHLQIRQPADARAGALLAALLAHAHLSDNLAALEVQAILLALAPDGHVHVARGVLRRAGAEAVQTEREFIVLARLVVVFAARVQLAEHELPVVAALFFVPVHRTAAAIVLDLDGVVGEAGDGDEPSEARARLVDGVRENLKHRVLAALQPVGAEDDAGALAHPIRALQTGDAVVVVNFFLRHIFLRRHLPRFFAIYYCIAFFGF